MLWHVGQETRNESGYVAPATHASQQLVRVVAIFRHFVLLKIMEYSPPAIVFEYLDFEDEEHEEHLGVIVEIQPAEERRVFDPFTYYSARLLQ